MQAKIGKSSCATISKTLERNAKEIPDSTGRIYTQAGREWQIWFKNMCELLSKNFVFPHTFTIVKHDGEQSMDLNTRFCFFIKGV